MPRSAETPAPRRRLPPSERRALIEEAAARLFAEHGFAGTRLADVAAAAGVTKPLLYRHFASKSELYLALLERHRAELETFAPEPAPATLEGRVAWMVDAWFANFEAHPETWKMLFLDTTGDTAIRAFRTTVQDAARDVFAAFVRGEPEIDVPAAEVEATAEILRSGMAGLARWWLDHPDVPRATLVEATVRVAVGLRTRR